LTKSYTEKLIGEGAKSPRVPMHIKNGMMHNNQAQGKNSRFTDWIGLKDEDKYSGIAIAIHYSIMVKHEKSFYCSVNTFEKRLMYYAPII